jgi:hypothetical protein
MENSQREFVMDQLNSIHKVVESPKSSKRFSIDESITHLDPDESEYVYKEELHMSGVNEITIKNYSAEKYNQAMREYLIGLHVFNPLGKINPCFSRTLGAYRNGSRVSILYERIRGNTLAVLLQEGMSFTIWLSLFFQLLLSLELAQRKSGFTHYDLHAHNVVVTDIPKDGGYDVSLDCLLYRVRKHALTPVIIDLGTCSTSLAGRFIGSYDYTNSGIFHFIVPGHDAYKLLVSSYYHARNSNTRKMIIKVFNCFGREDPYSINQEQGTGVNKARDNFCREISFSRVASYTPMMLIKYIYSKFRSRLSPMVVVVPRETRISLTSLNGMEDYVMVITSAGKLIDLESGYITAAYLLHIINHSSHTEIKGDSFVLKSKLDANKEKLIAVDLKMLEEVFSIEIPSQEKLDEARITLLSLPIRHRNARVKEQSFDQLDELLGYQNLLQPFLDTYFTILELKENDAYNSWVSRLLKSRVYQFYIRNKIANDRAQRWGTTLLASIFSES